MSLESLLDSLTRASPCCTATADVSAPACAALPAPDVERAAPVVRLHLTLEAENGARSEAILEVPAARYDGLRVLELFERHRMAGSTRVVAVRQESADDGRRFCRDCANLRNGVCAAASQIGALPGYRPVDDVPRRCAAFREREQ